MTILMIDYTLSSVHKVITEIQQIFHIKAKQVVYVSFTKIGTLHRGLRSVQRL